MSPLVAFRSRVGHSVPPAGMPSAPRQLFTMPMSIEQEVAKNDFDGWSEAKKGKLSERAAFHDQERKKRGPRVSLAKR